MPILPTSQRDQTKVAIAFVAVALAAYYYMYPYSERETELVASRERVEKLEGQNAKAKALASRNDLAQLRDEAQRAGASLEAMRRLVPVEREVPALLEEISTAARRANLEISGVAPEPVILGDEFDTYRYRVTVVGGFHALTTFLANVGSLPRIVAPVGFALVPASQQAAPQGKGGPRLSVAPLSAAITLQTYVAHAPAPQPSTSAGEALR
jgi:type IV pilus assembly protein PilO